jgi:hypothetical protein
VKEETVSLISKSVREKYGEMVSVSNVIQFLFDNHVATFEGFRNYYIRHRFTQEKEADPKPSDRSVCLQIASEVGLSPESIRYIVYP